MSRRRDTLWITAGLRGRDGPGPRARRATLVLSTPPRNAHRRKAVRNT